MVDIGEYNTCNYRCGYCYVNYGETKINKNILKYDKNLALLIGNIEYDDVIKIRR